MGKIEKAFESWFLDSLRYLNARKIDKALALLWSYVESRTVDESGINTRAMLECHFNLRKSVKALMKIRERAGESPSSCPSIRLDKSAENPKFICDAGLGGLARWLRATGYEAIWFEGNDEELIFLALQHNAILLTTDTMLFDRRILRDGTVRALWLPPTLKPIEQLKIIFDYFYLKVLEPRCMKCGGELIKVEKDMVLERIPPRTLKWLNEYYLCNKCDTLFWKGTHWRKITPVIDELKKLD